MPYDTSLFTKGGVTVNIFMLVSVILDQTRLTNPKDLRYAKNIWREIFLCVYEFEIGEQSGSDQVVVRYPIQGVPGNRHIW